MSPFFTFAKSRAFFWALWYAAALPVAAGVLRFRSLERVDAQLIAFAMRRQGRNVGRCAASARDHLRVAVAVARHLPGRPACLSRITAVRFALGLSGIASDWVFGRVFSGSVREQFHVWLSVAGEEIDSISEGERIALVPVSARQQAPDGDAALVRHD